MGQWLRESKGLSGFFGASKATSTEAPSRQMGYLRTGNNGRPTMVPMPAMHIYDGWNWKCVVLGKTRTMIQASVKNGKKLGSEWSHAPGNLLHGTWVKNNYLAPTPISISQVSPIQKWLLLLKKINLAFHL